VPDQDLLQRFPERVHVLKLATVARLVS
jgi:hypothetical protein